MEAKKPIILTWCGKHKNWWVTNCPDCMVDANEKDLKREGMKTVVEWIDKNITIPYPVGSMGYIKWKAQLKIWGL